MPVSNPASVTGPYALPVCSGPHHIPICTAAAHMPMCTTQPTWSLPGACNFAGIPACGIQHLPSCGLAQVSKTTRVNSHFPLRLRPRSCKNRSRKDGYPRQSYRFHVSYFPSFRNPISSKLLIYKKPCIFISIDNIIYF